MSYNFNYLLKKISISFGALILILTLTSCGNKGPLNLPERPTSTDLSEEVMDYNN